MPKVWESPEARDARKSMPEDQGHVKDPRYVPHERQAEYIRQWGIWMRAHKYREPWMTEFIEWMRRKQKPERRE